MTDVVTRERPTAMPVRLGGMLPSVFADDAVVQAFAAAVEAMFAPMLTALDCLPGYLDPTLAPDDWVRWLASWVGVENVTDPALQRLTVAHALVRHRARGTGRGLAEEIVAVFGIVPEIDENGAGAWSSSPDGVLPGDPRPTLLVRLRAPDPALVDRDALSALVERHRPAHVPARIEVVPET